MKKRFDWFRDQSIEEDHAPRWTPLQYLALTAFGIGLPIALFMMSDRFIENHLVTRKIATASVILTSACALVIWQFGIKAIAQFIADKAYPLAVLSCFGVLLIFLRDIQDPADWIDRNLVNIATVIGAASAIIVAIWTLILNSWISLRNQRIDVRILCIQRYDEFADKRPDLSIRNEANDKLIVNYFRRHWAIKKDQLDFWIAGYVDPEALVGWFLSDVGYFSGSSTSITEPLFNEFWVKVRKVPGSVDARLTRLVECIRADIVPLKCSNPDCAYQPKPCPIWQGAGLFWLLMELESRESWSIRGRRAHGIGRETFADLLGNYPGKQRRRIEEAGREIVRNREARVAAAEDTQAAQPAPDPASVPT